MLLLHLLALLILATPSTSGLLARSAWKEPSVQAEFETWRDTFAAVGVELTTAQLEEHLWTLATSYAQAKNLALTPIRPYHRWCGVGQGWQMFPAPQRRPAVLHIDLKTGDTWTPIYRARSAEFNWNRSFFDQDRIRTLMFLYGWPHIRKRGLFMDLQRWLAPRLAQEFPKASAARFRFYRYTTPSPAEVLAGKKPVGRYESDSVLQLQEYR